MYVSRPISNPIAGLLSDCRHVCNIISPLAHVTHVAHANLGDDDEPEWMVEFAKKDARRTIAEKRQEFEARLAKSKQEEDRLRQAQANQRPQKRQVCRSRHPDTFRFLLNEHVPINLLAGGRANLNGQTRR